MFLGRVENLVPKNFCKWDGSDGGCQSLILLIVVGEIFEATPAEGRSKPLHFFEWVPKTAEVVVAVVARCVLHGTCWAKEFLGFRNS